MASNISLKISAAILAGGKNSRIATEKSLLKIKGVPLIDKTVRLFEQIFPEVIIVSGKEALKNQYPNSKFVSDIFPDAGPLAGIHAALKTASHDAVFVFACDMPSIDTGIVNSMINFYQQHRNTLALLVPRHEKGYEPLHAVYRKVNIPIIEKQLRNKCYKISDFFSLVAATYYNIPNKKISAFYNINTSEDLEKFTLKQKIN